MTSRCSTRLRSAVPSLENGDHLDQRSFHERYEAMPEDTRAELIGGIVFLSGRVRATHGSATARMVAWLGTYESETPGTMASAKITVILDPGSEPEPDGCLLIVSPGRGQTHEENDYIVGAPELVVEVAASSVAIDLHLKRADYERTGVREYVVVILRQQRVVWFVRRDGRFQEMQPGSDGLFRSEVFPGLWLDPAALLRHDGPRVTEVLRQGVASPEHAAFVARLAAPPAAP